MPRKLGVINRKIGNRGLNNLTDLVLLGERSPFFNGLHRSSAVIARRNKASKPLSTLKFLTAEFEQGCLLLLFMQTHLLQTSENRDRVYGLLGIAVDYDIGDIAVDYTLSVTRVYSQIAEMYIRKYRGLIFLCYYTLDNTGGQESPTWLPNPEKKSRMLWMSIERWTLSRIPNASDGACIHSDGLALSVRGVCIDRISWVQSAVDASKIPILQWMEELGIGQSSSGIEDEQVLGILFPPYIDQRYSQYNFPRTDKAFQLLAVKKLFEFVNSRKSTFSLDDIFYGNSDLSNVATVQELGAFRWIRESLLLEKFFKTSEGDVGLIDYKTRIQNNDEIWALDGCPLPVILRPYSSQLGGYTRLGCIETMPGLMERTSPAALMENADLEFRHHGRLVQQIDIW